MSRTARGRARRIVTALTLGAATAATLTACGGNEPIQQPLASIATTTTRLASADIVGLDRRADQACAAPTTAPSAPKSIAVADPALLDGLCALGLQDRIVGVAGTAPAYLGKRIADLPKLTSRTDAAVTVGTKASADANRMLGDARTVPSPGADWKVSFGALADAVHLPAEGRAVIKSYEDDAAAAAVKTDALQSVISLVRFTADGKAWAMSTTPLAAQVLADLKAQRPEPQRRPEPVQMIDDDFSAADGDLIYVSFQGDDGKKAGLKAMETTQWKALRAVVAKRQLIVQDQSWYAPGGPVAAAAVLHDVTNTISSSS